MMPMTNEQWRSHEFYRTDPFATEIQPALLNSLDIKKYVEKGCLIEKVDFESTRLKTASYEMRLLGKLYDWESTKDGKLRPRCREICDGVQVVLPRNSITYLWMKEKILLPEYIAARFNLHIRYVHKGILLGTGPLVDPGFFGNLLIPLHNLTDNDYILEGGDGIIWVEFTKVSTNDFWLTKETERPDGLKEFPLVKELDNPNAYLDKARVTEAGGVQSAFKGALDRAQKSASDAQKEVNRIKNIGFLAIVIGFFAILGSIGALWFSGHNLIFRATNLAQESQNDMFRAHIREQDHRITRMEEQIEHLSRATEMADDN